MDKISMHKHISTEVRRGYRLRLEDEKQGDV